MDGANERLVDLLRSAKRILAFTGAGISTGSGIPDYRSPGGIWSRRRPVLFDSFMSSEPARIEYWDFKLECRPAILAARPTPVHEALTALERAGVLHLLVTQNIDGLHRQAGHSPERLVELHGTDAEVACMTCGETSDPGPHFERFAKTRIPPRCPCGGFLKPNTISFGQALRPGDLDRSFRAAAEADLVVALGSTLSVYPAAAVPLTTAERGVPYVIVNRGETEHDGDHRVTLRIEGDVAEIFPPAVSAAIAALEG